MEVILTCGYCVLFYYLIHKNKFFKTAFVPAWLPGLFFILKCLSGILLGLIYTVYYTNHNDTDTFKFFTDSKILFDSLFTKPYDFIRMLTGVDAKAPELRDYYVKMDSWLNTNVIFNDNKTIIRLNAFFRFFSLGYYNVHVVFINFISFTGLFCLYKTFISYSPDKKKELAIFTFLMPSVLFWGSGLLKDGLILSGIGLFIYSFSLLLRKGFSGIRIVAFLSGLTIMMFTKIYVLAILLPGILAWWLTRKSDGKKVVYTFLAIYFAYLLTAFSLYRINPDYNVAALIFYKKKNFIEIGNEHKASMISLPDFECSGTSILLNSPKAFGNVLFRPFLTDVKSNPLILLSSMENLLLILMFIICIISFSSKNKKTDGFILLSAIFIVLLFTLIGLITPVLGAIVRYRIVALPFLVFLVVHYYDRGKLLNRLSFLKRFIKTGSS